MTRLEDLNQIAQQLRDRRRELLDQSRLEIGELRNELDGITWDGALEEIDFECDEVAAALTDHFYDELLQINHALDLIDEGHYGLCGECGCQISAARLKVFPFAANCVSCQAAADGTPFATQDGGSDWGDDEFPSDPCTDFSLPVALKF